MKLSDPADIRKSPEKDHPSSTKTALPHRDIKPVEADVGVNMSTKQEVNAWDLLENSVKNCKCYNL